MGGCLQSKPLIDLPQQSSLAVTGTRLLSWTWRSCSCAPRSWTARVWSCAVAASLQRGSQGEKCLAL